MLYASLDEAFGGDSGSNFLTKNINDDIHPLQKKILKENEMAISEEIPKEKIKYNEPYFKPQIKETFQECNCLKYFYKRIQIIMILFLYFLLVVALCLNIYSVLQEK